MKITKLKLEVLDGEFTIHRFPVKTKVPNDVYDSEFFTISKTSDELSIVCNSTINILSEKREAGWSCFKVLGPLDFSLTGILAQITTCLAESSISIFAISTFDTDYILVNTVKIEQAKISLIASGYLIGK